MSEIFPKLVISATLTTPPGSPNNIDRYIVPSGATGAWSGYTNQITWYEVTNGVWVFAIPPKGLLVFVTDTNLNLTWNGITWVSEFSVNISKPITVSVASAIPSFSFNRSDLATTDTLTQSAAHKITSTAQIILPGDPTASLESATKQYVDNNLGSAAAISNLTGSLETTTAGAPNSTWGGYTAWSKLAGSGITTFPGGGRWRIGMYIGGTPPFPLAKMYIKRTLAGSTTVIDTYPVTFNGSASASFPLGLNLSDLMTCYSIDNLHDYYVAWYVAPGAPDAAATINRTVVGYSAGYSIAATDNTGLTTVPAMTYAYRLGIDFFIDLTSYLEIPGPQGLTGPASDRLSTIANAELQITTTATATLRTWHNCTATSANYALTLPAAASCSGQFIGIRIDPSSTYLVTVTGNAAELIDGINTRVMWAGENCELKSNGISWNKISGRTIPMSSCLGMSGNQTFASSVSTLLTFSQNIFNNAPTAFQVAASYKIVIQRPGTYNLSGRAYTSGTNSTANLAQLYLGKNGAGFVNGAVYCIASNQNYIALNTTQTLAANDSITAIGTYYNGSYTTTYLYNDSASGVAPWNALTVTEIPTW